MKRLLFILLGITTVAASAQDKLTTSRRAGKMVYIYKLDEAEALRMLSAGSAKPDKSKLTKPIDSFSNEWGENYKGHLPYGAYLWAYASLNRLQYAVLPVQNLSIRFISNKRDFQFILLDSAGRLVEGLAPVRGKSGKISYDPAARLYKGKPGKGDFLIRVKYQGVNNYFHFDPVIPPNKNTVHQDQKIKEPIYEGRIIFNKPKYRPLDTVRFKAYVMDQKGRPLRSMQVRIEIEGNEGLKVVVPKLDPYRDGVCEGSFVLNDSLGLVLDRQYRLQLSIYHDKKWTRILSSFFQYEDYQLSRSLLNIRINATVYQPGSPVILYIKATDENGFTLSDGRVHLTVKANDISKFLQNTGFVPDTLWQQDLNLDPEGETALTLPDSIFPKADLGFRIYVDFRNSSNEQLHEERYFNYIHESRKVEARLSADSVHFELLVNGKPAQEDAVLLSTSISGDKADSLSLKLPGGVKLDPMVEYYTVKTAGGTTHDIDSHTIRPVFNFSTARSSDTLQLKISNEQKLPFWYTIFYGEHVRKEGYTRKLDTMMSIPGSKQAFVNIRYLWGGKIIKEERSGILYEGKLNFKLSAPAAVYPGQKAKIEVQVTDAYHKPVPGADLTSWAYTSKFGNDDGNFTPFYFPPKNKAYRQASPLPSGERQATRNGSVELDYPRWNREMQLYQIPYYQFVYPGERYTSRERIGGDSAVVVPMLISNGMAAAANMVYIDGQLVYYSNTDQYKTYAFFLRPGKHKITLITPYKKVSVEEEFVKGYKTILGIVENESNTKASVLPMEEGEIEKYQRAAEPEMLYIGQNFAGNKALISNGSQTLLLNPPGSSQAERVLRVGPIRGQQLSFTAGNLYTSFTRSPGTLYVFTQNGLKTTALDSTKAVPYLNYVRGTNNYKDDPATTRAIDSLWTDFLDNRSRSFSNHTAPLTGRPTGTLRFNIDTSLTNHLPFLKNIILYDRTNPAVRDIFNASTDLRGIPAGAYQVVMLFKDNRYIWLDSIAVKANGINYFQVKDVSVRPADSISVVLDRLIKSHHMGIAGQKNFEYKIPVQQVFQPGPAAKNRRSVQLKIYVTDHNTGETMPGAAVFFKPKSGQSKPVGRTDGGGMLLARVPRKGQLMITYTGYESWTVKIPGNGTIIAKLRESQNMLNDVVIRGYTGRRRVADAPVADVPVANVEQLLQGRVAGLNIQNNSGVPGLAGSVNIRGLNSGNALSNNEGYLVIVNGKPYSGTLAELDQTTIASIEVLSSSRAEGLYGEAGRNGVILVFTNNGVMPGEEGTGGDRENGGMRTNFSDYAIWQPKLLTGQDGKASFTVTFPDDITNWNTRFFAISGKRQSGYEQVYIPAFKSLSATIHTPQFVLPGDRTGVIGKLVSYNGREERMQRKFVFNGKTLDSAYFQVKNSHLDTLRVIVPEAGGTADSVNFEYTLKQDNGYLDGERRKIPVLPLGVKETKGYFSTLDGDTTLSYEFSRQMGKVSLRAEASLFPVLLDEIEKLRDYEYLCNEQLASKLKALLLEKDIRKMLNQEFKEEKNILQLIKTLQDNAGAQGTWGWWPRSQEEMWISYHVAGALLQARSSGYQVQIKTSELARYLKDKLMGFSGQDQLFTLRLLLMLEPGYVLDYTAIQTISGHLKRSGSNQPGLSLYQQLQLVRLRQEMGEKADISWLLKQKKQTMFGNSYWGEPQTTFWDNSIQNTLLAYQILKAGGAEQKERYSIIRYFLEQRKDRQWRNTYESSLILETILPELLAESKPGEKPQLILNGMETVNAFPYVKTVDAAKLEISKKGTAPVYFTAYQQYQNPAPERIGKDFTVSSSIVQEGHTTVRPQDKGEGTLLEAGKSAALKVEVDVRADADYVMIEIPIPAGCAYENKNQQYRGIETHREYFKDKTSIFCTKLKQGKYTFTVQLMPRYSGNYNLNPAKAELMYFPVFYGREGMKKVVIK